MCIRDRWKIEQLTDGTYRIMPKKVSRANEELVLVSIGDSTPSLGKFDMNSDNSKWKAPQYKPTASGRPFKSLDFEAMVKEIKKKQMESTLSGFSAERKTSAVPTGFPFFEEARSDGPMDIDSLVSRIDAKIAELEAEEEAERKKQGADKKHHVIITEGQSNRARIARVIASATGESLEKAAKRLAQFPVDIAFSTKSEAVKFAKDVTNAGGKATIKTS